MRNVMSFKMRAERTSCARHITLDWIGYGTGLRTVTYFARMFMFLMLDNLWIFLFFVYFCEGS